MNRQGRGIKQEQNKYRYKKRRLTANKHVNLNSRDNKLESFALNGVKIFLGIFFVLVIYNIFLLVYTKKTENNPAYIFGYRAYIITTDSMKPQLKKGDISVIKKIKNKNELKNNDIITYNRKDTREKVTHRIIEKKDEYIVTKGDQNKEQDKEKVEYENIEGRHVFKIPYFGIFYLKTEKLKYLIILLLMIATIMLYQKKQSYKKYIRRIKKKDADRRFKEQQEKQNQKEKTNQEKIKEDEEIE